MASNTVVQLGVQRCVHVVNGVHRGGVVDQELPQVHQTRLLLDHLTLRHSLEEVRLVGRSNQCRLERNNTPRKVEWIWMEKYKLL